MFGRCQWYRGQFKLHFPAGRRASWPVQLSGATSVKSWGPRTDPCGTPRDSSCAAAVHCGLSRSLHSRCHSVRHRVTGLGMWSLYEGNCDCMTQTSLWEIYDFSSATFLFRNLFQNCKIFWGQLILVWSSHTFATA